MYKKAKGDILLIEDNPDDVELTLRALKKQNIVNDIIVVRVWSRSVRLSISQREVF
jgi:hypothetical protein